MKNNFNKLLSVLLAICMLLSVCISSYAADDALPSPDWVEITLNADGSKTVTFTSPLYLTDNINYYEYSTDSGATWLKISNPQGGELVFNETTEFSLRYIYSGFISPVYSVTVSVTKNTAITSSAGITLIIPFDSQMPTDVTVCAYEIVSGAYYNVIYSYFGEDKPFKIFDVSIMRNNKVYQADEANTWLFTADDFDVNYCKIYYLSDNGDLYLLASQIEINTLLIKTSDTGIFVVVEDKAYCKGDVNGDTLVTASDARLALRYSAQLETLDENAFDAADYNSDGSVTSADARLILRVSAGLE